MKRDLALIEFCGLVGLILGVECTEVIVRCGQVAELPRIVGRRVHQVSLDTNRLAKRGFGLVRLTCFALQKSQIVVRESQISPSLLRIGSLVDQSFLQAGRLTIRRECLFRGTGSREQQPEIVQSQCEVTTMLGHVGCVGGQLLQNSLGVLVSGDRLVDGPDLLGDRPYLAVGQGQIGAQGGILSGLLDEILVVLQRVLQQFPPDLFGSRNFGQSFCQSCSEPVDGMAGVPIVQLGTLVVSLGASLLAANQQRAGSQP